MFRTSELIGSAYTLLSIIGLWLLKRGKHWMEKRVREANGVIISTKEASSSSQTPSVLPESMPMVVDDAQTGEIQSSENTSPKLQE